MAVVSLSPITAFLPSAVRCNLGSAVVDLRPANLKSTPASFFPESEASGLYMNNQGPATYPIWSFEHQSALPVH